MITPSKPLTAPHPLKVAFPLKNGEVLRSQEREGLRKKGAGVEREKMDAQKWSDSFRSHYIFKSKTLKSCNCNCRKLLRIPE